MAFTTWRPLVKKLHPHHEATSHSKRKHHIKVNGTPRTKVNGLTGKTGDHRDVSNTLYGK